MVLKKSEPGNALFFSVLTYSLGALITCIYCFSTVSGGLVLKTIESVLAAMMWPGFWLMNALSHIFM